MLVISSEVIATITADDDPTLPNRPLFGYRNILTSLDVSADYEDPEHPASNVVNPGTFNYWASTQTGTQYFTIELDGLTEVDFLGIARANFGTSQISVSIEGATTTDSLGAYEWDEIAPAVLQAVDDPLLFWFTKLNYLALRVKMVPVTIGIPQMAVIYVGALLFGQRNIYVGHTPITMGMDVSTSSQTSESGQFLGRLVINEERSSGVAYQNLTKEWVRDYMMPFLRHAKTRPFFFAWRPYDFPLEVGYAWLTNNPRPVNQRNNGMMQVDLEFGGVA